VGQALNTIGSQIRSNQARGLEAIGRKVDDNIAKLNDVVAAIQRGMRVMAVGLDYARYNRFDQLTPKVYGAGEHRQVQADWDYAPSRDEYDYCVQFVITAALRLAELEADTVRPSWVRAPAATTFKSVDTCAGIQVRSDQFVTSGSFRAVVQVGPEFQRVVRPGGSQRGSQ
jgi:hypothetical protein